MSPFWESLDKFGIAFSIILGFVEVAQWIYMMRISDDLGEIQEDVEDMEEEMDENRKTRA